MVVYLGAHTHFKNHGLVLGRSHQEVHTKLPWPNSPISSGAHQGIYTQFYLGPIVLSRFRQLGLSDTDILSIKVNYDI